MKGTRCNISLLKCRKMTRPSLYIYQNQNQNQNQNQFYCQVCFHIQGIFSGDWCNWSATVGLSSLVDEANSRWEEAIFVARGFGPEGPQPPARGECLKEFVSRVGGVSLYIYIYVLDVYLHYPKCFQQFSNLEKSMILITVTVPFV